MGFFKRLIFYSFGFFVGIIILSFIFSGKKTTCNYSPNDRVIADISKKPLANDFHVDENNFIDSIKFSRFIESAKVDFNQSNTQLDSCKIYSLLGHERGVKKLVRLQNCSKEVTILQVKYFN